MLQPRVGGRPGKGARRRDGRCGLCSSVQTSPSLPASPVYLFGLIISGGEDGKKAVGVAVQVLLDFSSHLSWRVSGFVVF